MLTTICSYEELVNSSQGDKISDLQKYTERNGRRQNKVGSNGGKCL